jgi:hypothetical protein
VAIRVENKTNKVLTIQAIYRCKERRCGRYRCMTSVDIAVEKYFPQCEKWLSKKAFHQEIFKE